MLFSNVVDQAAQETAYCSAYTTWGGGINKPAAAAKSLAHISLLQRLEAFLRLMSTDMPLMDSMIQTRSEGIFTRALRITWPWTSCATLASSPFSFPKTNIVASTEKRHAGCKSVSLCPSWVPNIFIKKKQFPITGQHKPQRLDCFYKRIVDSEQIPI